MLALKERMIQLKGLHCSFEMHVHVLSEQKGDHLYTTNFVPLFDRAMSLGVHLYVGENAAYLSERFFQEIVSALGKVVIRKITEALQNSPFFVLMIDKTTDVHVVEIKAASHIWKIHISRIVQCKHDSST